MSRLADLVAGKGPGFAPGPIRELSQKSQHSQKVRAGKRKKHPCYSIIIISKSSLSCARGNGIEEGPPAKVANHAKVDPAPESLAPTQESETRRAWLIRHAGGEVKSHSFTPPATLPEVRAWYPAALAIEPEEDAPEGQEPAPPADFEALPDDRITCRACRHLTGARCQVAQRGAFSHRARWYEPPPERLRTCYLYTPLPHDPDQRPGAARWPTLEWMKRRAA